MLASTRTTSFPASLKFSAISRPINPPPMTAIFFALSDAEPFPIHPAELKNVPVNDSAEWLNT